MFTGLIEEVGKVMKLRASGSSTELQVAARRVARTITSGHSIAVNGCCLTAIARRRDRIIFDLLKETIVRTNLGKLRQNDRVNLERPLRAVARLDGHFVQGHIDCTAAVVAFDRKRADFWLEVELPAGFAHYVAPKSSIALNGTSLTVADVLPKSFVVWVIPYTRRHTNLDRLQPGDLLNVEFDILAKYVERIVSRSR